MFFYITLDKIATKTISDRFPNPLDKHVELYQTWQLCDLNPLVPGDGTAEAETAPKSWARQGFSVRNAPGGGVSFRKQDALGVLDPQITFALSDRHASEGAHTSLRFDVHYWESDSKKASTRVRSVFNDETLAYMKAAWSAAAEDEAKARSDLAHWFEENWQGIASGLLAVASPTAAGIAAKFDLLPALELLAKFALTSGDDYHQYHKFVFELVGSNGQLNWRVVTPTTTTDWKTGPGRIAVTETVCDGPRNNIYTASFSFRIVD